MLKAFPSPEPLLSGVCDCLAGMIMRRLAGHSKLFARAYRERHLMRYPQFHKTIRGYMSHMEFG
jgi:hypothetical protein